MTTSNCECTGYTLHFYDAGVGQSGSDKFYTAFMYDSTTGFRVVMNWGRDGARGQCKVQEFTQYEDARKLLEKKQGEKVRHGYEKLGEGTLALDLEHQQIQDAANHFKAMIADRSADKSRMSGGYVIHEEPDLMDLLS